MPLPIPRPMPFGTAPPDDKVSLVAMSETRLLLTVVELVSVAPVIKETICRCWAGKTIYVHLAPEHVCKANIK